MQFLKQLFERKSSNSRFNHPPDASIPSGKSFYDVALDCRLVNRPVGLRRGVLCGLVCGMAISASAAEPSEWRGFRGDGTSAASKAPMQLSIDEGMLWEAEMPGESVASPIIVQGQVISTSSAGQDGERMFITSVGLDDGKVRWEQSFEATGRPYCHPTSANAAPTPVSDGERIIAFFSSNDLICLSAEGDLLWYRGLGFDYPQAGNDIGMASSPTLADGVVVVQVEAQGDSFAAGIDAQSGQTLWRIDRPRSSNWSSPITVKRPDDSTEVVLQSGRGLVAVDPRSGRERWTIEDGRGTTPSPTAAGGLLLAPGNDLLAVDIGSSATTPEIAWQENKLAPRSASVAVQGDRLYSLKGSVLVAAELKSGEMLWQQRLTGVKSTWATPVVADGNLYVADQSGTIVVVRDRGDEAEVVSKVDVEEPVLASPAVADGKLVIRGKRTLYCFQ
ncbi:MAG: PQQ-binding-like beta-propeller repeat protein [Planctomycetota bacterium]